MLWGGHSLLNELNAALAESGGPIVCLRRTTVEDYRILAKSFAKQDDGKGVLLLFRMPSGDIVEPDGREREPSRRYIVPKALDGNPILKKCSDLAMTEQQTIEELFRALCAQGERR